MTQDQYVNARDNILDATFHVNPDASRDFRRLVVNMELEGRDTHETMLRFLIGRFYDGLAYGNW